MNRQIQVRAPAGLIESIDRLTKQLSTPHRPLTRSDVVRDLLIEAMERREALKAQGVAP